MNKIEQICIFCGSIIKKRLDNTRYGICVSCKIYMLKVMKKKEYKLLVKGEDVKLVTGRLIRELKGQGYKEIK